MIGNLNELATFRTNHPNISVSILVVLFSSAIRNECEACSIGRPLRIAVIPIVAFGDLFAFARPRVNDPKMRAAIIEPTRVVELVRGVLIVTDIAAIFVFRPAIAPAVTWSYATD